jgi:hypothetical protein
LVVDEVFKPVAAFGCSGEPEPVLGGYSIEDVEERAGGDVVAFVGDDETVDIAEPADSRSPQSSMVGRST